MIIIELSEVGGRTENIKLKIKISDFYNYT
jgi:hypothetical protein